jgi:ABC-type nitrate/sulfonate/bicarbonate transport system substrate-binding protein
VSTAAPAAPAAQPAGQLTKVRIIAIPGSSTMTWPYQYGIRRGWFAEEGLDPTLTFSFQQVPALIGGSVDIISTGAEEMVVANYRGGGTDIVAVGVMSNRPQQFLVTATDIREPRQFEGKVAGMTDLNSGDSFVIRRYLQKHGIDPSRVTLRGVGGSRERFAALEAGQIQITPLDPVTAVRARTTGKYNILATPNDLGAWPWNLIAVKRDWGQANRDTVVRVLRATWRVLHYVNDPANHEEVLKELPAASELNADLLRDVFETVRGLDVKLYDAERPKPSDLDPTVEFQRELGVITGSVDQARMIDTSFYDAAFGPGR